MPRDRYYSDDERLARYGPDDERPPPSRRYSSEDSLPREAVSRLLEGVDDFPSDRHYDWRADREPDYSELSGMYVTEATPPIDDMPRPKPAKRVDVADIVRGATAWDERVYEADYLEYIQSAADTGRRSRSRYLIQPDQIKQLTRSQRTVEATEKRVRSREKESEREREAPAASESKTLFSMNVIVVVSAVVFLVVLCFLILTITSLNTEKDQLLAENSALKNDIAMAETRVAAAEALREDNDRLTSENNSLTAEVDRLINMLQGGEILPPDEEGAYQGAEPGASDGEQGETPATQANPEQAQQPSSSATHSQTPTPGFRFITQPGQSLYHIARDAYGNGNLFTVIAEANSGIIPNPNQISAGLDIYIPPLS